MSSAAKTPVKKQPTRAARIAGASSERRERQKAELRATILKVAGELFEQQGYENFSLRQVAERIGYSPTTIYLYFANKDDLILATVQDGFHAFDNRMAEIARDVTDPLQRIHALGSAYIDFGRENPSLYRLMFMQRSDIYVMPRFGDDPANDPVPMDEQAPWGSPERPRTASQGLLVTAVADGMAAGQLKDGNAMIIADVLWAGAHGLVSLAISPLLTPEHSQEMIEPLLSTLIEGVRLR